MKPFELGGGDGTGAITEAVLAALEEAGANAEP